MIIAETMAEYQDRRAMSAGMAWTMANECPALAWHHSPFNPAREPVNSKHFDIGTAAHLAVLEPDALESRIVVVDADNWRTKEAQKRRDEAYAAGLTPLLGKDADLINNLRVAIGNQTDVFQSSGPVEVTAVWAWMGVQCKARLDKFLSSVPPLVVDLKTAASASPLAFQRAMVRDGHHCRAAWYRDGIAEALGVTAGYRFVVVGKDPPYLVTEFEISERAIEWGRRLYRRALNLFRRCTDANTWPGYASTVAIDLPAWGEFILADQEAQGEL